MRISIVLDSGAFSAKSRGEPIDLDQYIEFVHQYGRYFSGHFNLDILDDGAGSYRNWVEMRRQGLDPIPVFHVTTKVKWLRRYLRRTDRIAIGSMVRRNRQQLLYTLHHLWREYFLDVEGNAKYRVHGLGVASARIMRAFPWDSIDSLVAIGAGGDGRVFVPNSRLGNSVPGWVSLITGHKSFHKAGSIASYFGQPPMVRDRVDEYFKGYGYWVPDLDPGEEGRKVGGKIYEKPFDFGLDLPKFQVQEEPEGLRTLSGHHSKRKAMNYHSLEEVSCQIGFDFYHVVSCTNDLEILNGAAQEHGELRRDHEGLKLLISYFYLRNDKLRDMAVGLLEEDRK